MVCGNTDNWYQKLVSFAVTYIVFSRSVCANAWGMGGKAIETSAVNLLLNKIYKTSVLDSNGDVRPSLPMLHLCL